MNNQDKTKETLIIELEELQKKHNSLIDSLGENIAEKKQAKEIIQQKNKSLVALLKISQSLTQSLNITIVLQKIVDSATSLFELDSGAIYLLKNDSLSLKATTPALPAQFPEEFRHALLKDHPHIIQAISNKIPIIIPDSKTAKFSPAEQVVCDSRNLKSLLYLPLLIEEKVIGVIILGTVGEKTHLFSKEEINLYQTFAGQATIAIENAQLYVKIQQNEEKLKQDILDGKKKELEIQKSKDYLTNIINAVTSPIFVKEDNHNFCLGNNALSVLLKRPIEEIIGTTGYEYLPEEQIKIFIAKDEAVFSTGKENINEEIVTLKNGETLTIVTKKTLYIDSQGNKFLVGIVNDITEKKLAETALHKSEKLFKHVFESANVGKTITLPSGKITVNQAFCDILGYTKDELKDITWQELTPTEELQGVEKIIDNILEGKEKEGRFTQHCIHKNGNYIFTDISCILLRDEEGKPIHFITTIIDINNRKLAEEKLKLSEKKLRLLFENLTTGFALHEIILDTKGKPCDYRFLEINPAFEKLTGLKATDLIDKTALEVMPNTEAYWIKTYGDVALKNKTISFENYSQELDKHYQVNAYSPEPGKFATVFLDITERKKIEISLKESEEKFSKAFMTAPYVITISDPKTGKFIEVNDAFISTTGYTRKEAYTNSSVGLNLFVNVEDRHEVVKDLLEGKEINGREFIIKKKNGELINALFSAQIITLNNEKYMLSSINDITEKKKTEKEIQEKDIQFREKEIELLKAENATYIAKNTVKAKQQFLANMSHEIRTPMNAIVGFTNVVLKTNLTAKQREYLNAIKMSGDSLIVLVNDILDLSKVDAGKMTFEQIPFKLETSLSALIHLFEIKIQEKNLKLVKKYDNQIPEVLLGDPIRFHQIMLNLVNNAVKFTAKGKISINVKMLREKDEKVTIEFSVSDTGIGITDTRLENIFGNFQQASSSTSRLYGGTGLGLAIVKQLVEAQDGNISVKSIEGKGSIFNFTLPFQKIKAEAENKTELITLDKNKKNISVLVVEDIPLNQLLMKTLLNEYGFEQDSANNGKIAIEKLKEKAYDIVLMDLQMPEMDGYEATDYIRNTMNLKTPIIALTADAITANIDKCKKLGMNDYIAKPVDERILYAKILSLVQKKPLKMDKKKPARKTSTCINLDFLISRTKSNKNLIMEMISAYLEQTPPLIVSINQSMKDNDWKLLYASVHKLIPSFAIMGISKEYENMAKEIQEYASTEKHTDKIPPLVLELTSILEQACQELEVSYYEMKNTNL